MSSKIVYLVRHGETVSNLTHIVQGLDDKLSDTGQRQAAALAKRAMGLEFELFLSSDAKRTIQTASAIKEATGREFTPMSLFREIRRPKSFIGISRQTPEFQQFLKDELTNMANPDWQIEDGEHFESGKARALEALSYLERQAAESVLVVSHGHFMRYMVATILTEKNLTPELWLTLGHTLLASNTGITVCRFENNLWQVITWNDHAHFAE